MRRFIRLLTAIALVASLPASARASDLHFRIGAFFPRADTGAANDLFRRVNTLFTTGGGSIEGVGGGDWIGLHGGVETSLRLSDNFELGFHGDAYRRTLNTSYRDIVDGSGQRIFQTLRLTTIPVGFTLRFAPGGEGRFQPYIGGGGDFVWYRYEEFGDFVDLLAPGQPVDSGSFLADGWAPGLHVAGGVRVPINYDVTLVVEGRYLWAERDMGGDFPTFRIDLGGASATFGVLFRF